MTHLVAGLKYCCYPGLYAVSLKFTPSPGPQNHHDMPHLSHGPFNRCSHCGSLTPSPGFKSLRGNDLPSTELPEQTFAGKSLSGTSHSISKLSPTSHMHPTGINAKYTSKLHRYSASIGASQVSIKDTMARPHSTSASRKNVLSMTSTTLVNTSTPR